MQPPLALPDGFETIDQMLAREASAELIEGAFPQVGLGQMIGASYSGKSYVALHLAWHIAGPQYREWFDREINVHGPVIYYVAEGLGGLPARLRSLHAQYGSVPNHDLIFMTQPELFPILDEPTAHAFADAALSATGGRRPALVIIDTQSMLLADSGIEENDNSGMAKALKALRRMAEDRLDTLVLLVHHTGKDKDRGGRGASAQFGNTESQVVVNREGDNPLTARFTLQVVKHKDGLPWPEAEDFRFITPPGQSKAAIASGGPSLADVARGRQATSEAVRSVTEALEGHPNGLPMRELVTLLEIPRDTVKSRLKAARELGLVAQNGTGVETFYTFVPPVDPAE